MASDIQTPSDETPEALVERLVALLALEQIEVDLFRGSRSSEHWTRVFGGQVVGQALMAACRTVDPARAAHSLHAYFMRPGDPGMPIVYQVTRDRDGGSFSSRRVVAIQNGQPILNLAASFQLLETGLEHQFDIGAVAPPESLEDDRDIALRHLDQLPEATRAVILQRRPIVFRSLHQDAAFDDGALPPSQSCWFRAIAPLPADQTLHRVMLAYASDATLLGTSILPHRLSVARGDVSLASLDHALWIHRDIRLDDWLLYKQDSPWAGAGRGMNRGLIYTRAGVLVASVAQEGLIRVKRD